MRLLAIVAANWSSVSNVVCGSLTGHIVRPVFVSTTHMQYRAELDPLEVRIKSLMQEADSISRLGIIDADRASDLRDMLLFCAEESEVARFPYSAMCLRKAAAMIESQLSPST